MLGLYPIHREARISSSQRTIAIIAIIAVVALVAGAIFVFAIGGSGSNGSNGSNGNGSAGTSESNDDDRSGPVPVASASAPADVIVDHTSAQTAALGVSQGMFESAPVVIVSADDSWEAASYGAALGVPVLLADAPVDDAEVADDAEAAESPDAESATEPTTDTDPATDTEPATDETTAAEQAPAVTVSQELLDELGRLGTQVVLVNGVPAEVIDEIATYELHEAAPALAEELGIDLTFAAEPADLQTGLDGLGTTVYAEEPTSSVEIDGDFAAAERTDAIAVTDGAYLTAVGTAVAGGADVKMSRIDPRASSDTVAALDGRENVVAVFSEENPDLTWQLATAATGTELPGGGQLVFEGKRYVALYGSPHTTTLGVLGEQGTEATIARAEEHAAPYRDFTDAQVLPALEIIVTVASGAPGDDGNYSNEWAIDGFVPLIEAAQEAGQYVVLDFQPGRSDFLSQVKMYEELLEYPHVGVALDPEWRLGPDEVPLTRIGHVEIAEVNEVVTYLADFTRERNLPQKMLILHQFQVQMLRDIDQLDQSRSELAILVHVDGQGSQSAKQGTWTTLQNNSPHIEYWGWKNFYDEDIPMLDPAGTYQVEPLPDFVSYQ